MQNLTCGIYEVLGYHGVKYVSRDDGYRYYSVQDMLDAAGEPWDCLRLETLVRAVGSEHVVETRSRRFFYTDLRGMDYILNRLGTERAQAIWKSIKL